MTRLGPLAFLLLVATVLLLAWEAATAGASPAHRDAVLASTDEWIAEVLRVPIPDRADLPGGDGELGSGAAEVPCEYPREAHYDPALLDSMADRRALFFADAWMVALHEHEHMLGGPCVYSTTSPRPDHLDPVWLYFEEGFTDAVRCDLAGAFFMRMFGLRVETPQPMADYRGNVATVRALSRLATGSRSWRHRDARLWRRAALLASWPARQAMIAEANARRAGA